MLSILFLAPALAQDGVKWTVEELKLFDEVILERVEGGIYTFDGEWLLSPLDEALADVTEPEVRLWVVREGPEGIIEDVVVTDEPVTMAVARGEDVSLWASANEPDGGIARIRIDGGSTQGCVDPTGSYGTSFSALWSASNADPDPGDDDLSTWMLTALGFTMFPHGCPAGMAPSGFSGTFSATAENLAGLSASTAPVTIVRQ